MCTARVINRHWKGKVHDGFGLLALQILACARRCEVQSQVFVRRSEHLSPPLHGLPTSCVCASLCSCDGSWTDANGAWPTARFSKNVLFLALFSSLTSVFLKNGGRCRSVEHAGASLWFTFTIKARIFPLLSLR